MTYRITAIVIMIVSTIGRFKEAISIEFYLSIWLGSAFLLLLTDINDKLGKEENK